MSAHLAIRLRPVHGPHPDRAQPFSAFPPAAPPRTTATRCLNRSDIASLLFMEFT